MHIGQSFSLSRGEGAHMIYPFTGFSVGDGTIFSVHSQDANFEPRKLLYCLDSGVGKVSLH